MTARIAAISAYARRATRREVTHVLEAQIAGR